MIWEKVEKTVNAEGTTITYQAKDAGIWLPLYVQSRKRHIPHANGIGTWDHTTYHVIKLGVELCERQSLKVAKGYAEGVWQ